jgi:hypothetical protein
MPKRNKPNNLILQLRTKNRKFSNSTAQEDKNSVRLYWTAAFLRTKEASSSSAHQQYLTSPWNYWELLPLGACLINSRNISRSKTFSLLLLLQLLLLLLDGSSRESSEAHENRLRIYNCCCCWCASRISQKKKKHKITEVFQTKNS